LVRRNARPRQAARLLPQLRQSGAPAVPLAEVTPKIKELLQPYTVIAKDDPKMFEDLGDERTAFKMELGKGECAA